MGSVNISKTRRGESAYLIPTVSLRYREDELGLTNKRMYDKLNMY